MIVGYVINKFRGDVSLFDVGIKASENSPVGAVLGRRG